MFTLHLYNNNFDLIEKTRVIGTLQEAKNLAKRKMLQNKEIKEFSIYENLNLVFKTA